MSEVAKWTLLADGVASILLAAAVIWTVRAYRTMTRALRARTDLLERRADDLEGVVFHYLYHGKGKPVKACRLCPAVAEAPPL